MSGWTVEPDQPHSSLVYKDDEGRVTAAFTIDLMLLMGFHSPEGRAEIWEALCANVAAVEGLAKLPQMLHDTRIRLRDSEVARICAQNPGIDEDEVRGSVQRTMVADRGLPEDYWETAQ